MNQEWSSFWGHVRALRNVIFSCLAIIALGMLCALFYHQQLFSFLTNPIKHSDELQHFEIRRERIFNPTDDVVDVPDKIKDKLLFGPLTIVPQSYIDVEYLSQKNQLLVLGPLEGFLVSMKMSFWVGLVATSPLWIFLLLQFILPALNASERKLVIPFLLLSITFLIMGFLFAYYLTIPMANQYLFQFNEGIGNNFWSLSYYMEYTVTLLLANALAFELCAILLLLVHYGVISAQFMQDQRRYVIVAAFIIGAILTPPDILTQFMLAVPLLCLYELILLYAKFINRSKQYKSI